MIIRPVKLSDADAIWSILEPIVRAGESFALPLAMEREQGLGYWFSPEHTVFVAEQEGVVVGSYYVRANQKGGGENVANAGYMTAGSAAGRGVAQAMCGHSLEKAMAMGFRAMQFNFVVSSNEQAVHLWRKFGFEVVGRLPEAFLHPGLGYVDALVMYRSL
jgi:ribosomal protein S18 acetylase RimI-like enzyme